MLPSPVETAADLAPDGFQVLEGFLDAPALSRAAAAVETLLAGPTAEACRRPHNTLVPLRWDSPVVATVLADRSRVERVQTAAGGDDLRWISGYVSTKDARSPALWWHQDWWCWDHPASYAAHAPQIAVLCYLGDTHAGNGALRVLPGSHRRSHPLHRVLPEAHSDESVALGADHEAMRDQPGQRTLELRAGDAVVTDYRLLHSTHPNASDRRRDCVILNFAPSWGRLPSDLRGHLIQHSSLPSADEVVPPGRWTDGLLPSHDGPRRDLPLSRHAPAAFG